MRHKLLFSLLAVLLVSFAIPAFAQYLPFQGKLLENGQPVNGVKSFTFSINQGVINWSETHPNVPVNNGLYAVVLGSISALPANLFAAQTALNLNISVGGVQLDIVPIYPPIESDPTVPANIKDGITWNEIGNIPPKLYADTSATNELQHLTIQGNLLSISNGNTVEIPVLSDSTTINGDLVVGGTFQVGVQDTISNSICQTLSGSNYDAENTIWQSFTPQKTGVFSAIELEFGDVFNTNVKLTIYPGEGTTGQPIWSKTYNTNLFPADIGMRTFPVDVNAVSLTFGQVLTFQVIGISNGIFVSKVAGNPYPDGISNFGPTFDLKFCVHYSSITEPGVFVDENGNVGIGTNTPGAKLEVKAKEASGDANVLLITKSSGDPILKIDNTGNVGIGTTNLNSSAQLEVNSTSKGLLPPRMTSIQMNTIVSPAEGLIIYNTSIKSLCTFDGSSWTSNKEGKPCGDITYEGKVYSTIIIGSQCWMAQNLNVGTRIAGASNQANNGTIEKYCYNNLETNCDIYGGLYQWDEMMGYSNTQGVRGICPTGWHLPTDAEWTMLTAFLGGESVAGGKMKETGTAHWTSPNIGATNSSGFTALPGGLCSFDGSGSFYNLGNSISIWSSSVFNASNAWHRGLTYNYALVTRDYVNKTYGLSVRCVKD